MRSSGLLPTLSLGLLCALQAHAASPSDEPFWTTVPKSRREGPPVSRADLVARAEPAVVHVRGITPLPDGSRLRGGSGAADAPTGKTRVSVGTGFVIHRDGWIVTNEHVVREAIELRVRLFGGRELPACVVGADGPTDIALLKVEADGALPVLPLGDSDTVRAGDPVLAIGSPFGFDSTVTQGIVSAKGRVVDRSTLPEARGPDIYSFFIQTDASINVGNSGGPLVDSSGAAIAVSAAFWSGHPLQPAQGIGFAIPINMAKSLLPRLRARGDAPRSFIGVDAQPLDAALAVAFSRPSTRGALIAGVSPGSPAEGAGLEVGDIVLSFNEMPVSTSEDLKIDVQLTPPGSRIRVTLLRDGKRLEREMATVAAPGGDKPQPLPTACQNARPEGRSQGIDFDVITIAPEQSAHLPGGRGVSVSRVRAHGAAAEAGIHVGDVVLRIGNASIRSAVDLNTAVGNVRRGHTVPLLLRRAGYDFWTAYTRR